MSEQDLIEFVQFLKHKEAVLDGDVLSDERVSDMLDEILNQYDSQ